MPSACFAHIHPGILSSKKLPFASMVRPLSLDNATIDQLNKSIDYLKDYEIVGSEIRKKNYGISQFTVCLVLSVVFYFILFLFQGLKKKYNFMY